MVFSFENENHIYIQKGHLENKTTIKRIGVFGDIYPTKYPTKYMGKTTS